MGKTTKTTKFPVAAAFKMSAMIVVEEVSLKILCVCVCVCVCVCLLKSEGIFHTYSKPFITSKRDILHLICLVETMWRGRRLSERCVNLSDFDKNK